LSSKFNRRSLISDKGGLKSLGEFLFSQRNNLPAVAQWSHLHKVLVEPDERNSANQKKNQLWLANRDSAQHIKLRSKCLEFSSCAGYWILSYDASTRPPLNSICNSGNTFIEYSRLRVSTCRSDHSHFNESDDADYREVHNYWSAHRCMCNFKAGRARKERGRPKGKSRDARACFRHGFRSGASHRSVHLWRKENKRARAREKERERERESKMRGSSHTLTAHSERSPANVRSSRPPRLICTWLRSLTVETGTTRWRRRRRRHPHASFVRRVLPRVALRRATSRPPC